MFRLDVSYDFYHEEIDEDFERQKRMIEEELHKIVVSGEPDLVADKILSAAESIQRLADSSGNDDICLFPNIHRIKSLKTGQSDTFTEEKNVKDEGLSTSNKLPGKFYILVFFLKLNIASDDKPRAEKLTSINAVHKLKFRTDEEMFTNNTNSKRNTIGEVIFHI